MKTRIPPLNAEAADQIASILIESGLDSPKPVRGRGGDISRTRRRNTAHRRGFIDLAWKIGIASGTTLLISSLGWGVAFTNHDRAVRAEARAEVESEYRHQAEINALEARRLAEVSRRHAAEEARYTFELEQWQRRQQEDEQRIQQREQEWQTVLADAIEGVGRARAAGDSHEQMMELYFLAKRIQTLSPDDEHLVEQFAELFEQWMNTLPEQLPERNTHDGDA